MSPLVAYLATESCPLNGKVFFIQGGRVRLFQPWTMTEGLERTRRVGPCEDLARQLPGISDLAASAPVAEEIETPPGRRSVQRVPSPAVGRPPQRAERCTSEEEDQAGPELAGLHRPRRRSRPSHVRDTARRGACGRPVAASHPRADPSPRAVERQVPLVGARGRARGSAVEQRSHHRLRGGPSERRGWAPHERRHHHLGGDRSDARRRRRCAARGKAERQVGPPPALPGRDDRQRRCRGPVGTRRPMRGP